MKKISAYEIALSAISCAIAAIALTVGTLYTPLLFTGYLLACFALMIPLSKNCYWGDVLAFIGAGILALMFNGFNIFDTLPFLVFFGLHPLVNALQLKFKINRWIALAVKAVWFDAAMYVVWRFTLDMNLGIEFLDKYIIPVILIGGTAFFVFYDYVLFKYQISANRIINQIIRK